MASWLERALVLIVLFTVASATCVKPDNDDKGTDKNATDAGETDIKDTGINLKIEISMIYRKQRCFVCILESMPKVHLLLTGYIRAAILLRVVHQARARFFLLRKSFSFVRFIRISQRQIRILQRMKWTARYRPVFSQLNFMSYRLIKFVQGSLTRYRYIRLYRTHLMKLYAKVSRILVNSLQRWKRKTNQLRRRRRSLYALIMLTQLLWSERYLYERLINYEGSQSVEAESQSVLTKIHGFFVSTKIRFTYRRIHKGRNASGAFKVVNGMPVPNVSYKRKGSSLAERLFGSRNKPHKKTPSLSDRMKAIRYKQNSKNKKQKNKKNPKKKSSLANQLKNINNKKKRKRQSLGARWKSMGKQKGR